MLTLGLVCLCYTLAIFATYIGNLACRTREPGGVSPLEIRPPKRAGGSLAEAPPAVLLPTGASLVSLPNAPRSPLRAHPARRGLQPMPAATDARPRRPDRELSSAAPRAPRWYEDSSRRARHCASQLLSSALHDAPGADTPSRSREAGPEEPAFRRCPRRPRAREPRPAQDAERRVRGRGRERARRSPPSARRSIPNVEPLLETSSGVCTSECANRSALSSRSGSDVVGGHPVAEIRDHRRALLEGTLDAVVGRQRRCGRGSRSRRE